MALTLRMVGGLTVPEIARAFLVAETAMGQRITRAKAKIKAARIPYRVPSAEDLPARVSGVLAVLFLVFNEGYLATGPDTDPVRHDLTAEAIRLTRLIRALLPDDGEVAGLLALMLLTEARRTARVSAGGELVPLDEQDRGAWDAELIAEGHRLVRERLAAAAAGVAPGRYQILAAINAVHTSARDMRDTDWSQVLALYDQLVRLDPSPIIALNRAIAVAELDGPEVALAAVDRLERQVGRLSRLPRHPRRPAAPAGPQSAVARGLRQSHRAGGQHRRDRLPDPPPRPTAVAPTDRIPRQRAGRRNTVRWRQAQAAAGAPQCISVGRGTHLGHGCAPWKWESHDASDDRDQAVRPEATTRSRGATKTQRASASRSRVEADAGVRPRRVRQDDAASGVAGQTTRDDRCVAWLSLDAADRRARSLLDIAW